MKRKYIQKKIEVEFIDEDGIAGGLFKDWITNVNEGILKIGLLKPVPSKNYLTIDHENATEDLLFFTGQLIAIAFNNNLNLNINLTIFVWKLFKNEKIKIEDMEKFDPLVYQSLKWILENDVDALDEVFVDRNDEPLIKNGNNVKLTNENKNTYIKLMLKRMFLGNNTELFEYMVKGFRESVIQHKLSLFNAHELRETINGERFINVENWKNNTVFDSDDENEVNMFFDIISNWPQDDLRKLLKFVTGSSLVPEYGFYDLQNEKFNIEVNFDSDIYPEAHTCFNRLVLPYNNDEDELERKLLMAIEVVDYFINVYYISYKLNKNTLSIKFNLRTLI